MESCERERQRVELYDKWIYFHNEIYFEFILQETDLLHEVHQACPVIEHETPPACGAARRGLQEHRFWKMEPLGRTIDKLREKREELRQDLINCEHEAKGFLLA